MEPAARGRAATADLRVPATPVPDYRPPKPTLVQAVLVTFACYGVPAAAAFWLASLPGCVVPLWGASAVAIGMLQLRPPGDAPWLLAAAAAAHGLAGVVVGVPGDTLPGSLAGALVEVWVGAWALRNGQVFPDALVHSRPLVRTALLVCALPALAGALVATLLAPAAHPVAWVDAFAGHAVGCFSTLPVVMVLVAGDAAALWRIVRRPHVLLALVVVVAASVFAPPRLPFPYVYISASLVGLAAVGRFAAAAIGVLLVTSITAVQLALGVFAQPLAGGAPAAVLAVLPLVLTLGPPLMLGATLDRVRRSLRQFAAQEQRYRTLYQKTPVMMHSSDAAGRVVSASEAWLTRLGYTIDEVLGRASVDFLTPQSREQVLAAVVPAIVRDGRVEDVELQAVTRGGDVLDIRMSAIREREAEGGPLRVLAVLEDVTEEKRLSATLAAERERIEVTLHSIGDAVITTDEGGAVTYMNPVAQEMVGWRLSEARGRPFAAVVHLCDAQRGARLDNPLLHCDVPRRLAGRPESAVLHHRSGRIYGVQHSVAPILGRDGRLLGAVMVLQDVTEARDLAQRMAYLAHHDGLTDLPNRVLLQDRILQACQLGRRHHGSFAVVFMDLDHFKHVNDSLGHAVGDELLKTVARRLTTTLRASDTVCRLGGDEFVMLLTELRHPDDAAEVARKVLREVARPCVLGHTEVSVGISLGIAVYPADGEDPATLMKHADAAMYRAKREGRNRFHFFARPVDAAAAERLQLEADLRRSLAEGSFHVHYQPVVDATSRRAVAVEALARWSRPGRGPLGPDEFIPVAEESGLIVPLGELVLRRACEQLTSWAGTPLADVCVAVNVSPLQLADPGFADAVAAIVAETGADATRLEFEITESILIKDPAAMLKVLQRIKALGIRIAIDDFGTGYSSLSSLKHFPVDKVKIDRSFVRDLETDPDDRALVRAVVAMGRSLRLVVVAEGVETEGQASILAEMACSALQGYMFARPAEADSTTRWLRSRQREEGGTVPAALVH